jgi:Tfp pilus assembly protein PilF
MARGALEMALRNKPDYMAAHENLGDVYVRLAEQSYRKAAQLATPGALLQSKLKLTQQLLADSAAVLRP